MITVVSPRWMLDEVVVIVRVTLQLVNASAVSTAVSTNRISSFFIVLSFLFEYGSHGFSRRFFLSTDLTDLHGDFFSSTDLTDLTEGVISKSKIRSHCPLMRP